MSNVKSDVFFFNDYQQLIAVIPEYELFDEVQKEIITENKSELINRTASVSLLYDKEIADCSFFAIQEDIGKFIFYRVLNDTVQGNELIFTGIDAAVDELNNYIIQDVRPQNKTIRETAEQIISFTDGEWRINYIENGLGTVTSNYYYVSVKEALKDLQTFGCEIVFYCDIDGDGIKDKYLEIYSKVGEDSGVIYEYGENVLSIVAERSRENVFTSLIGRGKGEEVGDGYGRRIDFADLTWSISKGDPLDKPKGQINLEMPEMTKIYGIPTRKGEMRKREQVVIFEDIEDKEELLKATYTQLVERSRPQVQFKTEVTEADSLGNRVIIRRHDLGIAYETRIFSLTRDRLTGHYVCELGDYVTQDSRKQASNMQQSLQILDDEKMSFYDSTEISKWQSDIIRGAHGGSVIMMNPEDAGTGTSREPYQTVWMDGPDIDHSKHFLVANSEGIGFIDGDFWKDKFKTAWTIEGKFNADFIQAGKVKADIFQTSFNSSTNNYLSLASDVLRVMNKNNKRIMELGKSGMEFWRGNDSIGVIGTTGKNFSWVAENETSDRALFMGLNGGEFIRISNDKEDGLYVPKYSRTQNENAARVSLYGEKGVDILSAGGGASLDGNGIFRVDRLFVGKQEVIPGGGGGGDGWNGQFPPEVTSSADKFAWQLWATLLGKGYSKAAAAGVLGNVQGEAGSSMNPDIEQVGGPAYGIVQWDGSAYPLVGSPTSNGREYVQRLMKSAGISIDYKTMAAQAELLDWCMFNGQWIGRVEPSSVSGFKAASNPSTAANAFELNFERPAAAHPERQGWAVNWYNKFKDLTIPKGADYIAPLDKPYLITSEFGPRNNPTGSGSQMHNGIDLVDANGNQTAPIWSSAKGEVIYAQWNDGGYGNCVMIKHADGYITAYNHMSAIKVSVGQKVEQHVQVGNMGSTGDSTGPHMHFEIKTEMWSGHINPRDKIKF